MPKQFEWFCRERTIYGEETLPPGEFRNGEEEPDGEGRWVKYFVCVRLDNKLIGNQKLYEKLNIFPEREISGINSKIEVDKFRNFKDAANFGLFSEVQFTIVPSQPGRTAEPYGARYSSYAPYNTSISFDVIKAGLRQHTFVFPSAAGNVEYVVEPSSIRIKRTANNRGSG